jgi:hypothetical protein
VSAPTDNLKPEAGGGCLQRLVRRSNVQDDPKRMTEDEYVDFLVAQGMGQAQAKIFAAPHYHDPEDGSGDVGCDVNIGQQNEQADDHEW